MTVDFKIRYAVCEESVPLGFQRTRIPMTMAHAVNGAISLESLQMLESKIPYLREVDWSN